MTDYHETCDDLRLGIGGGEKLFAQEFLGWRKANRSIV